MQRAEKQLPKVRSQQALRGQRYGSGLQGRATRQRVLSAERDIASRKGKVSEYEKELDVYEQEVLGVEQQVQDYEKAVQKAQVRQSQLQRAYEVYTNQRTAGALKGIPQDVLDEARGLADKAEESASTQIKSRLKQLEKDYPKYDVKFNPDLKRFEGISKELPSVEAPKGADLNVQKDFKPLSADKNKLNLSTGFGLVSASSSGGGTQSGYSSITGNLVGASNSEGVGVSSQIRNGDSFISRLVTSWKKTHTEDVQKELQGAPKTNITTPSGVFVSAYPSGTGATAQVYPLSIEQQQRYIETLTIIPEEERNKILKQAERLRNFDFKKEDFIARTKSGGISTFGTASRTLLTTADFLSAQLRSEKIPVLREPLVRRSTLESIGTGLLMGEFFAPAFSTGAAANTKKATQVLQENKFAQLGEELGKKTDEVELLFKQEGKVLRTKTAGEKISDIRKIVLSDSTPEQKKAALELLKKTYGESQFNNLIRDFAQQEGLTVSTQKQNIVGYVVDKVPQIKKAGSITGFASQGQMFPLVSAQQNKLSTNIFSIESQPQQSSQSQRRTTVIRNIQMPKQMLGQVGKQRQESLMDISVRQSQVPAMATATSTATVQKQSQLMKTQQMTKQGMKQREESIIRKPGIIKLPEGERISRKKKSKPTMQKPTFDVFIRKKGKDVKVKSVGDIIKAGNELRRELEGSLAASGFVSKGGKRVRINLGSGFRPSKVEPLRIVQKRSKRLGTGSERKQIQRARRKGIKWL